MMRTLAVYIEIKGENEFVGEIVGNNSNDACFSYDTTYLNNPECRAISIGLPLEEKTFDAIRTRIFFEGLLPEGFTRKCVAKWMHMDENDYLSILAGLGRECLGAIKVIEKVNQVIHPDYRELSKEEVYALASEGASESAELVTKSHLSLTGAYDIVSTMVYKSSMEDMALSVDGKYNINEISRESFKNAAIQVGIGTKIAMRRFDDMINGFTNALNQAKEELDKNGIN